MSVFFDNVTTGHDNAPDASTREDGKYLVSTLVIYVLLTVVLYEAAPFAIDFWKTGLSDTALFALGIIPMQLCQLLLLFAAAKTLFPTQKSVGRRLLLVRPENLTQKYFSAWTFFTIVATIIFSELGRELLEMAGLSLQEQAIMETTRRCGFASLTVLFTSSVVLAPVIEEIFFRHVLYGSINLVLPKASSAILASLVFSAVHFSLSFALPLFVLAILLQMIRIKSGSVVPGIIIHGVFNFLNVLLLAMQMTE